tara:strand:- start:285 stop:773 length:489 start_codon:yes stop_codon:yes gene_type:complete
MKKLLSIALATILVCPLVYAQGPLEKVKMDVMGPKDGKLKRRVKMPVRLIVDHMMENGALTQEEIDANREEGADLRRQLHDARKAGDKDTARQIKDQMRAQRSVMRADRKRYLEENSDLRQQIDDMRAAVREKRREKRMERPVKEPKANDILKELRDEKVEG